MRSGAASCSFIRDSANDYSFGIGADASFDFGDFNGDGTTDITLIETNGGMLNASFSTRMGQGSFGRILWLTTFGLRTTPGWFVGT